MVRDRLIGFIPDWILFVIVLVVALLIYRYFPEDVKRGIKRFLMSFGVWIGLLLCWLYFRGKWGYVYEDPSRWPAGLYYATFIFGFIGLLYFAVKTWLYEHRDATDHFISDNIQGSCARYYERGDWAIFFLGTSGASDDRFVIPWPWMKKIVVVPKVAVQFFGSQILALSQVEKVDIDDLDEDIADFIENHPFARWKKDNIYAGLFDQELRASNPQYEEIQSKLKKQNDRINELKKMLKGKLGATKEFISDTFAMTDKIMRKPWRRREEKPSED